MPVVSAAIAAVSAAIATTTVATVASAVIAVSTAIGVAGLATTAVGMITGNKDILKAGKIMGFVGLAGGLAGGLLGGLGGLAEGGAGFLQGASDAFAGASGHLTNAWNDGLGSLFSTQAPLPLGVEGTGTVLAPTESGVLGTASSPYVLAPQGETSAFPAMWNDQYLGSLAQSSSDAISQAGVAANNAGASVNPPVPSVGEGAIAPTAAPAASNAGSTPTAEATAKLGEQAASQGPLAPVAPGQSSTAIPGVPGDLQIGSMQHAGMLPANVPKPTNATNMSDWFNSLPPALQASLAITGGQALSGAMGGLFQGLSAEKQLELQTAIANRAEDQRQFQNRNASYAPLLKFGKYNPPSLLNSVKGTT